MESGSIAKWNLKEGDEFGPGVAICEVETDKATVTYEATEDGYIAKILVGTGEVKVGQPIMVTVDDKALLPSFSNFKLADSAPSSAVISTPSLPPLSVPENTVNNFAPSSTVATAGTVGQRVFASPFARKIARDAGKDISLVKGTGPKGRIVAADVLAAPAVVAAAVVNAATSAGPPHSAAVATSGVKTAAFSTTERFVGGVFQDFELSDDARDVAARLTLAKQQIPHYYLSVEINLDKLLKVRQDLNGSKGQLSVLDFFTKAAALAMKQVPDVNASWRDTFVRRYEQVDINLVMGSGVSIRSPVVRDVAGKGLSALSEEIANYNRDPTAVPLELLSPGTFTIHNLGMFGVRSAAPIITPPQSCALALGAIADAVVPRPGAKEGEDNWQVSAVMTATLSCDHRVVDGAVGAQWLGAFKALVENPMTMIL